MKKAIFVISRKDKNKNEMLKLLTNVKIQDWYVKMYIDDSTNGYNRIDSIMID